MAQARSNVASAGDGAKIYKEQVNTKQLGLEQVAAHYAISSIFSSFAEETDLFCFRIWRNSYDVYTSGRGKLALGRVKIVGAVTGGSFASDGSCLTVYPPTGPTGCVNKWKAGSGSTFELG